MRFSDLSWTKDAKGFFYSRYPEPPKNKVLEAALSGQALYYHRVGTPQADDVLVYERKDLPGWLIGGTVTEDGRYLLITMAEGSGNENRLYYADLGNSMAPESRRRCKPVIEADDAEYAPIGNIGHRCSTCGRTRTRQIARSLRWTCATPAPAAWKTVVAGAEGRARIRRPHRRAHRRAVSGGRAEPAEDVRPRRRGPGRDCAAGHRHGGRPRRPRGRSPTSGISSARRSTPSTVYRYDPATRQSTPFEAPTPPVDVSQFETVALLRDLEGRHARAVLHDREEEPAARRQQPHDALRLRRLLGHDVSPTYRADVPAWLEQGGVWVTVEPPRRRGVRRGLAQGRDAREEAERLRRLHRRGRAPGQGEDHLARKARGDGRIERRPAGRRGGQPAPGSLRGVAAGGGRDGHAALRPLHRRAALGGRVRIGVEPGAVPVPDQVLAGAEPASRARATRRRS